MDEADTVGSTVTPAITADMVASFSLTAPLAETNKSNPTSRIPGRKGYRLHKRLVDRTVIDKIGSAGSGSGNKRTDAR